MFSKWVDDKTFDLIIEPLLITAVKIVLDRYLADEKFDYINGLIYLTTNLSSDANSYMAVNRTFSATGNNIIIYGPLGLQYVPQLAAEDGRTITTEDGRILLIG